MFYQSVIYCLRPIALDAIAEMIGNRMLYDVFICCHYILLLTIFILYVFSANHRIYNINNVATLVVIIFS